MSLRPPEETCKEQDQLVHSNTSLENESVQDHQAFLFVSVQGDCLFHHLTFSTPHLNPVKIMEH